MAVGLSMLEPRSAVAEPYIAMRTGYKCSTCHVNKTGGGKRTEFGVIYSQTRLPLVKLKPKSGASLSPRSASEDCRSFGASGLRDPVSGAELVASPSPPSMFTAFSRAISHCKSLIVWSFFSLCEISCPSRHSCIPHCAHSRLW